MPKRTVALVIPIHLEEDDSLESLQENTLRFIQEHGEGSLHEVFPLGNFIFLEVGDSIPSFKEKTYNYSTHWSEVDGVFIAEVKEFPSLMTHGDTADEALKELQDLVAFVVADLEAEANLTQEPQ